MRNLNFGYTILTLRNDGIKIIYRQPDDMV
jgi:hypothetical protein